MRFRSKTRGRPRTASRLSRGTTRLLSNVPELIADSYPVNDYGLSEGWAIASQHWQDMLTSGELDAETLRTHIVLVAGLASAMLESYLRAQPIGERGAAFDQLCVQSHRVLSGRPGGVILQSGIVSNG